jgi:sulfopyruvate decarboxylase TPP-binding subunit
MDAATKTAEPATDQLSGAGIIAAIKAAGIEYIVAVPDLHTSKGLLMPIARDPDLKLIRVCKEDECLGIAAGLSYGNKRALVLIQHTGFFYAQNAIRGVAVEQKLPICFMIGLLNNEPGKSPRESRRVGLRNVEPFLDLWGIPHDILQSDADLPRVSPAYRDAYENSHPTVFLIGRRPVAP